MRNHMNRFEALRKERDLSQEYVSDLLGVSKRTYQRYTVDQSSLEVGKLIALARLYDCSTDYLLGLSGVRDYGKFEKLVNAIKALL